MNIGEKERRFEIIPAVLPIPRREEEPDVVPEKIPVEEPQEVPAFD